MKVCLDPGHHGMTYNQSTEVSAYYESWGMWKLHLYLKEELEKFGFEVITTRATVEENPEVYTRGCMAKGCDLFLSLHSNACGTESVDYPVVFRAYDNLNGADTVALNLANSIASLMGTSQNGKTATNVTSSNTEYYGVMRGARAVGCPLYLLIEHSFHTNKNASLWLVEDDNLRSMAKMEAELFAQYYGMNPQEDTSTYTKIMGTAEATTGQMKALLYAMNPSAEKYLALADYYEREGAVEGVRGDIAFAQACLETGYFQFGGDVLPEQNNFCGLGATGNGETGCSFATMEEGVRAQIQHLKAYGSSQALLQVCIDPRFQYVSRGCAEFVEWLGICENPNSVGWATGAGYGQKILTILEKMKEMEPMKEEEKVPEWMETAVNWMVAEGLMMGDEDGSLRVHDPVTRGEFAVMLYAYHQKF